MQKNMLKTRFLSFKVVITIVFVGLSFYGFADENQTTKESTNENTEKKELLSNDFASSKPTPTESKDPVASPVPSLTKETTSKETSENEVGKELENNSEDYIVSEENDEEVLGKENEDAPVAFEEIAGDQNLTERRPWRAPNYGDQEKALGYSLNAFDVPKGLEIPYQFWISIYSKYSTDQGLIHDADNMDLIYEVMDFSPISSRTDLKAYQKEGRKIKMVKEAKMRVANLLTKLHKTKNPETLNLEEKKVWDYFAKIEDKNKFKNANSKSRIRFQLGQRDRIIQGIFFSGRYLEEFEKIFKEAGLPIELTRLPFVESSFNILARSKVGASGLWQIMRGTGKPYMMINDAIDKRNHPIEATKIAAKLHRNNFKQLKTWPMAVTGWNHGPNGLLKSMKMHKTNDLGMIAQLRKPTKRRLGFASRNFYVSFLAVLEVEKKASQYLGPVTWSKPLDSVDVKLSRSIKYKTILEWFSGDDSKTQIFNPHITTLARKNRIDIPKGAIITVPKDKEQMVVDYIKPSSK